MQMCGFEEYCEIACFVGPALLLSGSLWATDGLPTLECKSDYGLIEVLYFLTFGTFCFWLSLLR